MPQVRLTNQPDLWREVTERQLIDLKAYGLVLDLDPVSDASYAEAPVKEATSIKKADKAPTTENEVKK
ncbi:hypothetical protein AB0G86_25105 [Streptomyces scabiei]|uniref:hypothetical protein n=1 Tax=Streptomyces scabiei TaxID=1930 RepID=UPI0034026CC0